MIKIENPVYMTCREMEEKYPNCMVFVGKYKNINKTNGNPGGYPFAIIEDSDHGTGILGGSNYSEWKPLFICNTYQEPEDVLVTGFVEIDEDEFERVQNENS
ncbi:MAG: hypothetical protein FWG68_07145 [Defluviitaleaceae bacterium]|nr:hypothetical protein [Defluviitaleaceae bacterium]